jgi:hypothetical protein
VSGIAIREVARYRNLARMTAEHPCSGPVNRPGLLAGGNSAKLTAG